MLWEKLLWRLHLQWIIDILLTWPFWARMLEWEQMTEVQRQRWGAKPCCKDNQVDLGGGGINGRSQSIPWLAEAGESWKEASETEKNRVLRVMPEGWAPTCWWEAMKNRTGFIQKLIGIYPGPKQKRNRETYHLKMKWSGQKKHKKFSSKTESRRDGLGLCGKCLTRYTYPFNWS